MNVANKKEWLAQLREEPAKQDRNILIPRIIGALLCIFLAFVVVKAHAEPLLTGADEDGVVTLYSDDCQLTDYIAFPRKATWMKDGQVAEACVIYVPEIKLFLVYRKFDKTLWIFDPSFFHKVTSA